MERMDDRGVRSVISFLPQHPDERMRQESRGAALVLPSNLAPLVTQVLELPADADESKIHVGEAYVGGGGRHPFVRAVWFTPRTADLLTGQPEGTHLRSTNALWQSWSVGSSDVKDGGGGGGSQPATGVYTELGFGVMPGTGRTSVGGSSVPYVRNEELSCAFEKQLGEFMSDVSVVLHSALPCAVLRSQGKGYGASSAAERAVYQYPRLRDGVPPLHSHQVVLRGPTAHSETTRSDVRAWLSASDLHVDPWDGGGELGTCTVYSCQLKTACSAQLLTGRVRDLLLHRGLAVFPDHNGGRGVHIRTLELGWQCALVMRTRDCLHGSVLMEPSEIAGLSMPDCCILRVVTYPLNRIENLLARAAETPDMWDEIRARSGEAIRKRIEERLVR